MNGFTPNSKVVDGPVCIGNWCPQNYGHSYSGSVTLTQAITRSINVVPVKLSIALGGKSPNPAKAGRVKITEVARRFGLTAPLPDTPSMPIGSDEVTVLEHAVAYATFPNKGKSVKPHAVLEVRTGTGDLVWRFDRDGKKPLQAIPASVAADMAGMMSHVVSEGTARRAALDGIPTAGKTGTTNAYRDAWFVGYTGNFTCAVWYGNDDYSPTNRMTGGSLPAQTWHDIMVAAHQGVEVKEIAGIGMGTKLPQPTPPATVAANSAPKILGDQAGTAAGADETRRRYPGARRKAARRRRPRPRARRRPTIRRSRPSRRRPARWRSRKITSPRPAPGRRQRELRHARTDPCG